MLVVTIISVMICSTVVFYFYKRNNYNAALYEAIWHHTILQRYLSKYETFFILYGEYPQSAQEMRDSLFYKFAELKPKEYDEVDWYLDWISMDFFASDNRSVTYYPIYNRQRKRVSAVILSVGIDGRKNNHLEPTDTLFVDDWWRRLNFSTIEGSRFSLWNYFFGNRDYLVGVARADSIDILAERNWFKNREMETDSIDFSMITVTVIEPETRKRRFFRSRKN